MRYLSKTSKTIVCRRCIGFSGENALIDIRTTSVEVDLPFELTEIQKQAAHAICEASKTSDVLVNAVCGAGKTELVMDTIKMYLSTGQTIGLAIARKQVVLQLAKRLKSAFPSVNVQAICEGQTQILSAQLFVVTTHQLYRFNGMFDCLILDEPDAFPFAGDALLEGFAEKACRGRRIYLTATPDQRLKNLVKRQKMVEVRVNRRPHKHPLPVPTMIVSPYVFQLLVLAKWIGDTNGRRLIFVPTIAKAKHLSTLFRIPYVSAASLDLAERIAEFASNDPSTLITTTVLERGVTFANAQVCVLCGEHSVFTESSLIQIAGRAGRSPLYPNGKALFLCERPTRNLRACLINLRRANRDACFVSPR